MEGNYLELEQQVTTENQVVPGIEGLISSYRAVFHPDILSRGGKLGC